MTLFIKILEVTIIFDSCIPRKGCHPLIIFMSHATLSIHYTRIRRCTITYLQSVTRYLDNL